MAFVNEMLVKHGRARARTRERERERELWKIEFHIWPRERWRLSLRTTCKLYETSPKGDFVIPLAAAKSRVPLLERFPPLLSYSTTFRLDATRREESNQNSSVPGVFLSDRDISFFLLQPPCFTSPIPSLLFYLLRRVFRLSSLSNHPRLNISNFQRRSVRQSI